MEHKTIQGPWEQVEPAPDGALARIAPGDLDRRQVAERLADEEAVRTAFAGLRPNSQRAYATAVAQFRTWLDHYPLRAAVDGPGKAFDHAVARYLEDLARHRKSLATLGVAKTAIAFWLKTFHDGAALGPLVAAKMREIRVQNMAGKGRGQVDGLTWEQAEEMADTAGLHSHKMTGLRDASLILVASAALTRISELAALTVADVDLQADPIRGEGIVRVRRAKTRNTTHNRIGADAVCAIRAWLDRALLDDGPLWRRIALRNGDELGPMAEPLSTDTLKRIIQARARAAGIHGRVAGHSFRVGSTVSGTKQGGISPIEIQHAGGWTNLQMVGHYAAQVGGERGALAEARWPTVNRAAVDRADAERLERWQRRIAAWRAQADAAARDRKLGRRPGDAKRDPWA